MKERESLEKHVNESICNKRRRRTSYHYNWLLGPTGPHLPRSSTVLKQKRLQHASFDAPVLYHLQGYCYTCVLPPPPHLTPLISFLHPSDFHHFPPPHHLIPPFLQVFTTQCSSGVRIRFIYAVQGLIERFWSESRISRRMSRRYSEFFLRADFSNFLCLCLQCIHIIALYQMVSI